MSMLWIRGILFTLLVPCVVGVLVPWEIRAGSTLRPGLWQAGWVLIAAGSIGYGACLLRFLAAGGTPTIYFARPLRFLIGEEPGKLVHEGLYRVSRNPMYLSVLMIVFGQALIFASARTLLYGLALWAVFHVVVVCLEEPHLRRERGAAYDDFCRQVPRWLFRWR
jgi:protein-S-isoprenylcysteine O-methyltransferase Ste14